MLRLLGRGFCGLVVFFGVGGLLNVGLLGLCFVWQGLMTFEKVECCFGHVLEVGDIEDPLGRLGLVEVLLGCSLWISKARGLGASVGGVFVVHFCLLCFASLLAARSVRPRALLAGLGFGTQYVE